MVRQGRRSKDNRAVSNRNGRAKASDRETVVAVVVVDAVVVAAEAARAAALHQPLRLADAGDRVDRHRGCARHGLR